MKTIPRNRSSLLTSLFVLGGLAALYYYRRQGGELKPLLARGTDLIRTAREKINTVAPEVTSKVNNALDEMPTGVTTHAREISMAPEDMDRFPST